jgi:hypothetical protein
MFGDAWSNPLIFVFNSFKGRGVVRNCYFDIDGGIWESYSTYQMELHDFRFITKNSQYVNWLDHGNYCDPDSQAKQIIGTK